MVLVFNWENIGGMIVAIPGKYDQCTWVLMGSSLRSRMTIAHCEKLLNNT